MASGSGWNLWVWLLGVVVRRYIDFLILLIPTLLYLFFFAAASLLFVNFKNVFLIIINAQCANLTGSVNFINTKQSCRTHLRLLNAVAFYSSLLIVTLYLCIYVYMIMICD